MSSVRKPNFGKSSKRSNAIARAVIETLEDRRLLTVFTWYGGDNVWDMTTKTWGNEDTGELASWNENTSATAHFFTGHEIIVAPDVVAHGGIQIDDQAPIKLVAYSGTTPMDFSGTIQNDSGEEVSIGMCFANALNLAGGDFRITRDIGQDAPVDLTIPDNCTVRFNTTQHIDALTLGQNSIAKYAQSGTSTLVVNTLTMDPTSTLDLADDSMIQRHGGSTGKANLIAKVQSGQNGFDENGFANWSGTGIISSSAKSVNQDLEATRDSLAVLNNADFIALYGPDTEWTSFNSELVNSDDVIVKYTLAGDTNLDGKITIDDWNAIDGTYSELLANLGWASGDSNYDGSITIDDYNAIDLSFSQQPISTEWQINAPQLFQTDVPATVSITATPGSVVDPNQTFIWQIRRPDNSLLAEGAGNSLSFTPDADCTGIMHVNVFDGGTGGAVPAPGEASSIGSGLGALEVSGNIPTGYIYGVGYIKDVVDEFDIDMSADIYHPTLSNVALEEGKTYVLIMSGTFQLTDGSGHTFEADAACMLGNSGWNPVAEGVVGAIDYSAFDANGQLVVGSVYAKNHTYLWDGVAGPVIEGHGSKISRGISDLLQYTGVAGAKVHVKLAEAWNPIKLVAQPNPNPDNEPLKPSIEVALTKGGAAGAIRVEAQNQAGNGRTGQPPIATVGKPPKGVLVNIDNKAGSEQTNTPVTIQVTNDFTGDGSNGITIELTMLDKNGNPRGARLTITIRLQ